MELGLCPRNLKGRLGSKIDPRCLKRLCSIEARICLIGLGSLRETMAPQLQAASISGFFCGVEVASLVQAFCCLVDMVVEGALGDSMQFLKVGWMLLGSMA